MSELPATADVTVSEAPEADEPKAGAGGAPSRNYVVLEQIELEDEQQSLGFIKVHEVEARNGTNAMRKAYKDLRGQTEGECVLVVIPESMWKPTRVSGQRKDAITVAIGEPIPA